MQRQIKHSIGRLKKGATIIQHDAATVMIGYISHTLYGRSNLGCLTRRTITPSKATPYVIQIATVKVTNRFTTCDPMHSIQMVDNVYNAISAGIGVHLL